MPRSENTKCQKMCNDLEKQDIKSPTQTHIGRQDDHQLAEEPILNVVVLKSLFFKLHHLYGQKVRVDFFSGEVWSTHMLKNIWKQSGDNEDRMIQLYHDRINRTNIQDDRCWSRPCPRPLQVSSHKDISSVSTRQNPKLRVTYQLTTCQGIT